LRLSFEALFLAIGPPGRESRSASLTVVVSGLLKWGAGVGRKQRALELEITPEVREDHAAYIGHWLKALHDDKRLIFTAAAHAQRAADYLHGLQPACHSGQPSEAIEELRAAA
jgi:antirestriction protein ArdC